MKGRTSKKSSRLGEKRLMKNGQVAEIIEYNNSLHILIKFEDGRCVPTRYEHFHNGTVQNPNLIDIIGERNIMKNGQEAEIIACKNHSDIDVRFEDGTIEKHKDYGNFKKGQISNRNFKTKRTIDNKGRLNEPRIMKNGLEAIVTEYRNYDDIDVYFPIDGYTSYNRSYYDFEHGNIKNPNYHYNKVEKSKYIGKHKVMNNGQEATITDYRNSNDIDVQFEDGEPVYNKQLSAFNKGTIANPKCPTKREPLNKDRVGESNIMNSGLIATIYKYRSSADIDVIFDDGAIKENVDYGRFLEGSIAHPNDKATGTSLQEYTIMFYLRKRGFSKLVKAINKRKFEIDIFNQDLGGIEYDGKRWHKNKTDKENNKSKQFYQLYGHKLIHIRELSLPSLDNNYSKQYTLVTDKPFSKEYEKLLSLIFKVEFNFDIDVNLSRDKSSICKEYYKYCTHIGERKQMNNGLFATLTEYRGCDDIDVKFDDGYVSQHKQYSNFKRGNIAHRKEK